MELLEKHFDTAFAASDGIRKLRELIMTLATQGKLLPQNPRDESTESLIQKNHELILEATGGKQKKVSKLRDTEVEIPASWTRCQLGDIALVVIGNSPPGNTYNDHGDGVPLINGPVEFSPSAFGPTLKTKYTTAPSRLCRKGDLLVCVRGATTGRTNISAFEACIGRGVALVRGWAAQPYLNYLFLRLGQQLLEQGKGTTFPSISYSDLAGLEIWLPPLAEQRRIVAKIDQLMARCDELEKLRAERDRLKITVHRAACDRLLTAPDTATFTKSWQFITEHFSELYTVKENVAELRKAILQLAVMGKLVEQDQSDEPVESLLHKINLIRLEKIQSNKKIKNSNLDLEISETQHEIPDTWKWIKLESLVESLTNGLYKPAKFYSDQGVASIRMYNIQDGCLELSKMKRVLVDEHELENYGLEESDLIVNRVNSRELVGKTAIVTKLSEPTIFEAMNIRVRFLWRETLPEYINLLFRTQRIRYIFQTDAKQASGQASISQPQVANIAVPLPPLPEQHRIVAKVDQLMTLCDTLEQQIDATTQKQTALLNATLANI